MLSAGSKTNEYGPPAYFGVINSGGEAIRNAKTEPLGFQMTDSRRRELLDIANVNWPGSTSWTLYADGYRRGDELV
jgi:hypothetical protein